MGDNYRAIFDAVVSRISRCNPNDIIERVVREQLDVSFMTQRVEQNLTIAIADIQRRMEEAIARVEQAALEAIDRKVNQ